MKFIKRICAKIAGLARYLKYMGKLIQALKVVSAVMPQIALLVPEKQETLTNLAETLTNITGKMETTEKYLNEMGVVTTTETLQRKAGENITLNRAVKMLEKIDEDLLSE